MAARHYADRLTRFWAMVKKSQDDGCWIWTGATSRDGYGLFGRTRKGDPTRLAHRISWAIAYGEEVPKEVLVLHRCDNPPCVNPDHLFMGSPKDNVNDCRQKGRLHIPSGVKNPNAKLSEEEVRQIRKEYRSGQRAVVLAQRYGITRTTVATIARRALWPHID